MENKRLELVPRDSSDEHNVAECKEISHRDKMCSCKDDVAEKTNTSEGDGACGDCRPLGQPKDKA